MKRQLLAIAVAGSFPLIGVAAALIVTVVASSVRGRHGPAGRSSDPTASR